MNYSHIKYISFILLIITCSNCSRDKFCHFTLLDKEVDAYEKLSEHLYFDSSFGKEVKFKSNKNKLEVQNILSKLNQKPTKAIIDRSSNRVSFLLKKQTSWFMETDYINLVVSINENIEKYEFDDTDKQVKLNCQNILSKKILLRSITVEN